MTRRSVAFRITRRADKTFDIIVTTTTGRTFRRRGLADRTAVEAALQDLRDILAVLGLDLAGADETHQGSSRKP